jgi:hypothetical protein
MILEQGDNPFDTSASIKSQELSFRIPFCKEFKKLKKKKKKYKLNLLVKLSGSHWKKILHT